MGAVWGAYFVRLAGETGFRVFTARLKAIFSGGDASGQGLNARGIFIFSTFSIEFSIELNITKVTADGSTLIPIVFILNSINNLSDVYIGN